MAAKRAQAEKIPQAEALRKNIAANVRKARLAAGLKQREVGDLLSRDYVVKIEHGQANVSIDVLNYVARQLNISPIDLLLPPKALP